MLDIFTARVRRWSRLTFNRRRDRASVFEIGIYLNLETLLFSIRGLLLSTAY
jgi:hypothetical protein